MPMSTLLLWVVCSTSGLILCYNTIDLLITNNKPIELRRETKGAWPPVVSLTTLFLHSLTPVHSVSSLVCCCTGVRLEAPRFWHLVISYGIPSGADTILPAMFHGSTCFISVTDFLDGFRIENIFDWLCTTYPAQIGLDYWSLIEKGQRETDKKSVQLHTISM